MHRARSICDHPMRTLLIEANRPAWPRYAPRGKGGALAFVIQTGQLQPLVLHACEALSPATYKAIAHMIFLQFIIYTVILAREASVSGVDKARPGNECDPKK